MSDPVPDGSGPIGAAPSPVVVDPFEDDTPIVGSCDLSNPETCDSCQ